MRRGARTAAAALGALGLLGAETPPPPAGPVSVGGAMRYGPIGPIPGGARVEPRDNPYRDDPQALADGRRYFVAMNCSGCHGGHAGGGMGPSLRDDVWIYGGSGGSIFDSIAQGRAYGMPAWGSMLPDDLIWRLTAYVQSLRTPKEPDPPR